MTFIKYISRNIPYSNKLSLSKTALFIGTEAYEQVGKPERLEVYFDIQLKALKIEAAKSDQGRRVNNRNNGRYQDVSLRISHIMPKGRYMWNAELKAYLYEGYVKNSKEPKAD